MYSSSKIQPQGRVRRKVLEESCENHLGIEKYHIDSLFSYLNCWGVHACLVSKEAEIHWVTEKHMLERMLTRYLL